MQPGLGKRCIKTTGIVNRTTKSTHLFSEPHKKGVGKGGRGWMERGLGGEPGVLTGFVQPAAVLRLSLSSDFSFDLYKLGRTELLF
jgi:hypothetical protein